MLQAGIWLICMAAAAFRITDCQGVIFRQVIQGGFQSDIWSLSFTNPGGLFGSTMTMAFALTCITGTAIAGRPYTTACSPNRITFPGAVGRECGHIVLP